MSYFHFEQLSIIPVVSLLLTFNKYTASGVLSFSIHQFYRSVEKKQTKMSAGKKTIEEKQIILLENMQRLR